MTTPQKVNPKGPQDKQTILILAQALGNISAACRKAGIHRSYFYEIKRRYELGGLEALKELPPIPKTHPQEKSPKLLHRILELTVQYPAWGHQRLAAQARLEGLEISSTTIHQWWKQRGLNKAWKRWLYAEEQYQKRGLTLSPDQVKQLEHLNPCLKERHVESRYPGYLLCQDTFLVGAFKGIGRVYLQAVVDTYCSFAFAQLYTRKDALSAAHLLQHRVLGFYQQHGLKIQHLLTDNGSEYCGRQGQHYYQIVLALNGINHRRTQVARPRTNGFVERFNRTILNEFFKGILRRKYYRCVAELQKDLDRWLDFYNHRRPHLGYRNQGNTPGQSFEKGKNLLPKKAA